MELEKLNGTIIGVIGGNVESINYNGKKVTEIITKKKEEALKMVRLDSSVLEKNFDDLGIRDKNKVILASKLHEKVIVLEYFLKGLLKKDIDYFKGLFKKIVSYGRRIILIDNNTDLFLNCVDMIYVIKNDNVLYQTETVFDKQLKLYVDLPKLVEFTFKCEEMGIRINQYNEFDELLKAIYRIKS